ncbi:hypothetical protein N1851_005040 [Merluccius polli]|uniref:Uncharacterized protein n=1 Tax=Merluccius polli TaxID=89951 RepID=A0AA47N6R0_MERPO|nr:hypothetical protein N1851_005040 [Merluccius polli]
MHLTALGTAVSVPPNSFKSLFFIGRMGQGGAVDLFPGDREVLWTSPPREREVLWTSPPGDREVLWTTPPGDREVLWTTPPGDREVLWTSPPGDREVLWTSPPGDREVLWTVVRMEPAGELSNTPNVDTLQIFPRTAPQGSIMNSSLIFSMEEGGADGSRLSLPDLQHVEMLLTPCEGPLDRVT